MRAFKGAVYLALLLGLLAGFGGLLALGNPIPVPTLIMPEEHISARIFAEGGKLWAIVEGVYPFSSAGITTARMYYPVPPDAAGIKVWLDGLELHWDHVTCGCEISPDYPTVVGAYRMIRWEIPSVPEQFEIKVRYKHEVPQIGGRYAFLYALGTGRFLQYYAKETTAYVKVRLELDLAALEAFVGARPVDCRLDREAREAILSLVQKSEMFRPLTEDLLIKFDRLLSIPEAIDADGDGRITDREMLQAVRYWIDDAEVPGTGGQRINDLTLHKLAEFWVLGGRFVIAPYQARDRVVEYLLERDPSLGLPPGAIWEAARATPEGLLGYETIRYTSGDWTIEVGYPVVPYPDYAVSVNNSATGFAWQGKVRAAGLIAE